MTAIKPKDRDLILQALAAGVVPRTGLRHIQVGRVAEVTALVRDIDRIASGGSAVRFIIGEYGAGKKLLSEPCPPGRPGKEMRDHPCRSGAR